MRVAIVHSAYRSDTPSGENRVVEAEAAALGRAGHEVRLLQWSSDDLGGSIDQLRAGARVATGFGRHPLQEVRSFGPDLVHVHNLFPNLGRTWVRRLGVPLVVTVHNFRFACANGLLYRDGAVCTRCPDGMPWSGLRLACYRSSRLATLPLTIATAGSTRRDPLFSSASRLLVLSARVRDMLLGAGIAESRLQRMDNFLPRELEPRDAGPGGTRWLYVGRLRDEKGIAWLLRRWPAGVGLDVVGDGPDRALVEELAVGRDVRVLGAVERDVVLNLMGNAIGVVVPSRCFEHQPLVYPESLAMGTPILAVGPHEVVRLVEQDGTGFVVGDDEPLAPRLEAAARSFPGLRAHCRQVYEANYREAAHVQRLTATYREVIRTGSR